MNTHVKIIKADPAVAHVNAYTGGRGSSNGGFIYIALKPLEQRKASATERPTTLFPDAVGPSMATLRASESEVIAGLHSGSSAGGLG